MSGGTWLQIPIFHGTQNGPFGTSILRILEPNKNRLARTERALDDLYRQQEDPALAELRERLVGLEIDQAEADEALRASVLRLKWLAGAVLALSLGLAAAALLLGLG